MNEVDLKQICMKTVALTNSISRL